MKVTLEFRRSPSTLTRREARAERARSFYARGDAGRFALVMNELRNPWTCLKRHCCTFYIVFRNCLGNKKEPEIGT